MNLPYIGRLVNSRRIRFTAGMVLLFTVILAACHAPQPPQQTSAAAPSRPTAAGAPRDALSPASPFAVASKGASAAMSDANNFNVLIAQYPPAKQAQIKAWYQTHAVTATTFTSNAQWQWMRRHNYPTPDEILSASLMSDQQLRDLALRGDVKADFLYLARLVDETTRVGGLPALPGRQQRRLKAELSASMDRALASGSAFAGYMFGDYYAALNGAEFARIGRATGLIWADGFGDSNAVFHSPQALMGFPGVSGVRAAEVYFDMFAAAARVNPYFLNSGHAKGDLFTPLQ